MAWAAMPVLRGGRTIGLDAGVDVIGKNMVAITIVDLIGSSERLTVSGGLEEVGKRYGISTMY
jgi:hypothetical protein